MSKNFKKSKAFLKGSTSTINWEIETGEQHDGKKFKYGTFTISDGGSNIYVEPNEIPSLISHLEKFNKTYEDM